MDSTTKKSDEDDEPIVRNPKYTHGLPVGHPDFLEPCCNREDRGMDGWCRSCGDPCL